MFSRFLENISFGISAGLATLFSHKPDVIYANTWPIFALGILSCVAACRGVKLTISAQDIYPESLISQGRIASNSRMARVLRLTDRWIARNLSAVIVISQRFAELYNKQRRVRASRIHVIPNWMESKTVVTDSDPHTFRIQMGIPKDAFVVVYSGNIGQASGVQTVIEAWGIIPSGNSHLVIAGEGGDLVNCQNRAAQINCPHIAFYNPYPVEDTAKVLASADLLVLPTYGSQSLFSVPSKMIAYMLAGKPILALALPDSDLAETIAQSSCGWTIAPDRPDELASKITELVQLPAAERERKGYAGKEYALTRLTKETCLPRVIKVLEDAAFNC